VARHDVVDEGGVGEVRDERLRKDDGRRATESSSSSVTIVDAINVSAISHDPRLRARGDLSIG
jgi:hypothetical protein